MGRPSPWLLADDGIVDDIAVDVAARGERRVALTAVERELAARRIIDGGGDIITIAENLGIGKNVAADLARKIRLETAA